MLRSRGNKGEVAAIPLTENAGRVKRALVNDAVLEIENVWFHRDQVIFKFKGIDSISAAEALAGAEVCIPLEERLVLPEGEYYQSDLIGYEVLDLSGTVVGKVADWQEYGGPPLLEVKTPAGKNLLIPFAKSICTKIDLEAKRIIVELPEGLDDLE